MINQVHVIGQGIIGEVAASGKHQWINFQLSEINANVNSLMFKGNTEWLHQILAGIKTVTVISSPGLGVMLFGSTQKIYESPDFVAHAQYFLRQLGIKQLLYEHVDWNLKHQQERITSVISFLDPSFKNNTFQGSFINLKQDKPSSIASGLASMGSQIGTRSQTCRQNPHGSLIPAVSTSSGSFNDLCDLSHGSPPMSSTSSHQFIDQQTATRDAQILLPFYSGELQPNFNSQNSSLSNFFKSEIRAKETGSLSFMEQNTFSGLAMQEILSMTQTSSHSSTSCSNTFSIQCQNSTFSNSLQSNIEAKEIKSSSSMEHGQFTETVMPEVLNMIQTTSQYSTPRSDKIDIQCENSTLSHSRIEQHATLGGSFHGAGKLSEFQHCSSPPVSVCSISTGISSSRAPSQDQNLEISTLSHTLSEPKTRHFHEKPTNNLILVGELRDDQVNEEFSGATTAAFRDSLPEIRNLYDSFSLDGGGYWNESTSHSPTQLVSDSDMFEGMEVDLNPMVLIQGCWDDIVLPDSSNSCLSHCLSEFGMGSVAGASNELFSDSSTEQLLDVAVPANANAPSSCNSSVITDLVSSISSDIQTFEKITRGSLKDLQRKPTLARSRIDDSCSVNARVSAANVARKRPRPGETTRPRPKDRQQIQDRVKELREIIPNGAKCSIDALLERTIGHMIFLQNVVKYANKIKEAGGPKMIVEANGVVLKDYASGGLGSATWAYQAAGQTMVCPILVDDLHPSGQMLIEMLCEDRGLFLEIADIVCGFGLTILKGDMEVHGRKIWARFIVEAKCEVTRMDIFLSLVHLLQQTCSSRNCEPRNKAIDAGISSLNSSYQQSPSGVPIGLLGCS